MSAFLNALPGAGDDQSLILGYPLQAVYLEKESEPDIAFIQPVFMFRLTFEFSAGGLKLECQSPRPEMNLRWIESTFKGKPETQRNFMSACGFLNQKVYWDDAPGLERGEPAPHLDHLVKALESFMPDRIEEALRIEAAPDTLLQEPFNTGIYNRFVLMPANKIPFHVNLLKELAAIEGAPDDELDKTALRYLFAEGRDDQPVVPNDKEAGVEVADFTPLNAEQRLAASSLLTDPITIVTGPPGTGKSQVVTCAVVNARLRNSSVLFTSHNHKAIDAVMGRFEIQEIEPLIRRANSKDDPNLKFTFRDAITMILEGAHDPDASERFTSAWNELDRILMDRGSRSRLAEEVALVSSELGRIEERKADLSREMPNETVRFLEHKPEAIPLEGTAWLVNRVKALKSANNATRFERLSFAAGSLVGIFKYRMLLRTLREVPELPQLPSWPVRSRLKELVPELPVLERVLEYSRLRIASVPWEKKATELPGYEELSRVIAGLTKRIEELTQQIVLFDAERRKGLPSMFSREELHGLKGIIRDLQTGMADGAVNRQAVEAIRKYAPVVLGGFPCWVVPPLKLGPGVLFKWTRPKVACIGSMVG
ncbi:MAG: hypothetical protein KKB20_20400, partial [Proteobacteria bacterium]|nr:hypothetical protein [Pseudomonadota bacterium]